VRLCILISVVCVLTAFGSTRPEPGFDPREVARQVRSTHSTPGRLESLSPALDDGEFLIDTNSTLVPAPGNQNNPVIAFDGANFLVVWEDHRGGAYTDIWGTRVTPQGTVLDISGFIVSQVVYDQLCPAVAFDGANFLVVWQDYRSLYHSDIYGARVTPGGVVLDPSGFAISQAEGDEAYPALAFDGANFLVVWEDYRNGDTSDIYAARVTPGGTVLDPSGIPISTAANGQYSPVVGFGGPYFTVVWQDCRTSADDPDLYAARVTPEGVVRDPDGFAVSRAPRVQGAPAIGFDGTNFLVVWQDLRDLQDLDIYGARLTPWGVVLDGGGIPIAKAGSSEFSPDVAFDGANFLVVWQSATILNSDIYAARVTPQGTVLDTLGFVISVAGNLQVAPALAFDGANFLVVWQDYRNGVYSDIYGTRVTPGGELLDPFGFVIPQAAREQLAPVLAFDGANYLVVWEDHRGGSPDIYGARVTPGGTVLDPDGIAISQAPNWELTPALAFDGANYLVVWEDRRSGNSDIYGARVTPGGTVLDPDGIAISQATSSQNYPAIGFDGANYFVVWQDHRNGNDFDIYGARVTPAGTVLDPGGIAVSSAAGDQLTPAIGFDGASFLLAWSDYRNGDYSDVYGTRVTPGGTVLDPQGLAVSRAPLDQSNPVLGFDGTNFLLAWTDYRSGIYSDIYGARVTPQGMVLDISGLIIVRAAEGQYSPALGIGFDGTNYLVVWEDYRSDQPDIYGAVVTPDGMVSGSGPVVRQEGNQLHPALARGAGNELFLVYQGWVGRLGDKTYNTDRTWGKFNPVPGSIEESPKPTAYRSRPTATIVRGVLFLPRSLDPSIPSALLDISGRKVLDLHPGANDVRILAPGVYFCRLTAGFTPSAEPPAVGRRPSAVTKVVITR
jgi:hypothetical protein